MSRSLALLEDALQSSGLKILGCFHTEEESTLVLIGNAGPEMWRAFETSGYDERNPNPLDDWSRRTIEKAAERLSYDLQCPISALFPFDGPPYHPFQRWATRSGNAFPTPIGPLLHPEYGMWHAYRGALCIECPLELPVNIVSTSPCATCADKSCLETCPVDAFTTEGYDVSACLDLLEKEPVGECFSTGCMARKACPVGQEFIYEKAQAGFHMEKFLKAHRS